MKTITLYYSPSCAFSAATISFFVLRWREAGQERPFRVPFYPLTPALHCLTCAYLLYSNVKLFTITIGG